MRNFLKIALIAITSALLFTGCPNEETGDAESATASSDTGASGGETEGGGTLPTPNGGGLDPLDLYSKMVKANEAGDLKASVLLYAPATRRALVGGMLYSGFAAAKKGEAQKADWGKICDTHKIDTAEVEMTATMMDEYKKKAADLADPVEAYVDVMGFLKEHEAATFGVKLEFIDLVTIIPDGDGAKCTAFVKRAGKEMDLPLTFLKVDGRWYLGP